MKELLCSALLLFAVTVPIKAMAGGQAGTDELTCRVPKGVGSLKVPASLESRKYVLLICDLLDDRYDAELEQASHVKGEGMVLDERRAELEKSKKTDPNDPLLGAEERILQLEEKAHTLDWAYTQASLRHLEQLGSLMEHMLKTEPFNEKMFFESWEAERHMFVRKSVALSGLSLDTGHEVVEELDKLQRELHEQNISNLEERIKRLKQRITTLQAV